VTNGGIFQRKFQSQMEPHTAQGGFSTKKPPRVISRNLAAGISYGAARDFS
jgi:hypothetical protein